MCISVLELLNNFTYRSRYNNTIQLQVPGSRIFVVATRADKLFSEDERQKKSHQLLNKLIKTEMSRQDFIRDEITRLS